MSNSSDDLDSLFDRISVSDATKNATDPRHLSVICSALSMLRAPDVSDRLQAMIALRAVTTEPQPPVDAIIDSEITPIVIHFVAGAGQRFHPQSSKTSDDWKMIYEASWVLLNLLAGNEDQVNKLLHRHDAVDEPLLNLLLEPEAPLPVKDHGCWGIGNIAGTGPGFRDDLISKGAVGAVVGFWGELLTFSQVDRASFVKYMPNISWCLLNLSKSWPSQVFGGNAALDLRGFLPYADVLISHGLTCGLPEVEDDFATIWSQLVDARTIEGQQTFAERLLAAGAPAGIEQYCATLLASWNPSNFVGMLRLLLSLSTSSDSLTEAFFLPRTVDFLFFHATARASTLAGKLAIGALRNVSSTPQCVTMVAERNFFDACRAFIDLTGAVPGAVDEAASDAVVTMQNVLETLPDEQVLDCAPQLVHEIVGVCAALMANESLSSANEHSKSLTLFREACDEFFRFAAQKARSGIQSGVITAELAAVVAEKFFSENAPEVCQWLAHGRKNCLEEFQLLWQDLSSLSIEPATC